MIFRRALLRELTTIALAVFVVLLAITITTQLIRFLGDAASGSLASDGVLALLGFRALNYFPVLLSLTLFISVLMTLTRAYRDSEMIVWFSAGMGLSRWIRPVLVFAVPLVFTIALLSITLSPWAVSKSDQYQRMLDNRDDVSAVAPGVFKESKHSERVYFVENYGGKNHTISNIFAQSMEHQKLGIMVAKNGYEETAANGDRFLVMMNGSRYEGLAGSPEYKIINFERYALRIEAYEAKAEIPSTKALSTLELLRDRSATNLAELHWRIGLPISAIILALLAIPMSYVNPRMSRSLNLIVAILVYMIYSNFISISQAWIGQEKMGALTAAIAVHGTMLVVLVVLFYRRLSIFSLWQLLKRWRR